MQKLKLILILPLMTLISCQHNFPEILPQERCVNVFMEEKIINGDKFYSGFCRCHNYSWTIDKIGRASDSIDYELNKCNKLIGFTPDVWQNVWTWWEEIRLWLNRQIKK